MGINITQWWVQILHYWKFVSREHHNQGKCHGKSTAPVNSTLALMLSFVLITAPSLLLQAGDVERNPGPPKRSKCCQTHKSSLTACTAKMIFIMQNCNSFFGVMILRYCHLRQQPKTQHIKVATRGV